MMQYAYAQLSRTGLCNMLFPWARAVVYAHETGARMIAPQWTDFKRIGPWLRGERDKRYYLNAFSNHGYVSNWLGLRPKFCNAKVFAGMAGFFDPFLDRQPVVSGELRRIVNPKLVATADAIGQEAFIGVHVRRGDFVVGGLDIADDWYVKAIAKAREIAGPLPVKIFSDGRADKLASIVRAVKDAAVMLSAPAIQDLLSLSHAKILVGTAKSTFSMWGVFLGQMPSVWKAEDHRPDVYLGHKKDQFIIV